MAAEAPEVTSPTDRCLRHLRHDILARIGLRGAEERVDLARLEAEIAQLHAEIPQIAEFQRQKIPVPARLFGQPVVGEDVGPLLCLRQMSQFDHRNRGQPQHLGRHHPAMTGDDAILAIDQHRIGKAKLPDRAGDQRHLRRAVGPGIPGVGDEITDRPMLDPQACTGGDRRPVLGLDLLRLPAHPVLPPPWEYCGLSASSAQDSRSSTHCNHDIK